MCKFVDVFSLVLFKCIYFQLHDVVSVASVAVAQVKLSKICVLVPEIAGSGFVMQRTR